MKLANAALPSLPSCPTPAVVDDLVKDRPIDLVDSPVSPPGRALTVLPSAHPLPIKPVAASARAGSTTISPATVKETIVQTPLGPVSSLAAFTPPVLSFSAFTQPCKRFYLVASDSSSAGGGGGGGCPQTAQSCRFSHAFPFTPEERSLFPMWSKSTVCMDHTRQKCKRGESCYQGHRSALPPLSSVCLAGVADRSPNSWFFSLSAGVTKMTQVPLHGAELSVGNDLQVPTQRTAALFQSVRCPKERDTDVSLSRKKIQKEEGAKKKKRKKEEKGWSRVFRCFPSM